MKFPYLFIFLVIAQGSFAQSKKLRRLPDQVILLNGEVETGKVIKSDSIQISLQKQDFSEKIIQWDHIEKIAGLSYSTFFISPSIGLQQVNYFSTFLYDNVSSGGMNFQLKIGRMKRMRHASYFQITKIPVQPYNITKVGYGYNYYLFNDYIRQWSTYAGGVFEMTSVKTNANGFFNYDLHLGFEYLSKWDIRFFSEISYQKTIFNINNGNGVAFNAGMRFSREYKSYYKKLNTTRQL